MTVNATVDDTIKLTATFRTWDDEVEEATIEDPVLVEGYVLDQSEAELDTFTPTKISDGIYFYDWTPQAVGIYILRMVATFADTSEDVVEETFYVETDSLATGDTLMVDTEIKFAGILTPLCINPDELLQIFPDATELDVAEALWRASTEAHSVLGLPSDTECPTSIVALDFIKASAACELSRVFELGDGNEQSMVLGDFSVTYRSFPKSSVNRGNATTWCELAAALRNEMIYKATSPRAFVAGAVYDNPIPERKLDRLVRSNSSIGYPLMIDPTNPNDPTLNLWGSDSTHKQGLLDGEPS